LIRPAEPVQRLQQLSEMRFDQRSVLGRAAD